MTAAPQAGDDGPLALICGGGSLPLAIAEFAKARGRKVVLFLLRGAADAAGVEHFAHHWVYVGQIGKFMRLARAEGCRDVVFIGSIVRPSIWHVHPDMKGLSWILPTLRAFRGGDDHLLSGMARLMERDGFRLLGAHEVAPEILVPEGTLGKITAGERDDADATLGFECLQAIAPFDVGQAVVVAGRHVLAVEAIEGTDLMLERVATLRANGRLRAAGGVGVLVKAPKRDQDRRFDLPSIGPTTIECVARAGLAGIAVAAGETIIAEPEKTILAADRAGLFIVGRTAAKS